MDDHQFEMLQKEIELCMELLKRLQALYRKETGKDFVPDLRPK